MQFIAHWGGSIAPCGSRRRVIQEAMQVTGTSWDYQPLFDAAERYWREG
jgi:hypothetical protein